MHLVRVSGVLDDIEGVAVFVRGPRGHGAKAELNGTTCDGRTNSACLFGGWSIGWKLGNEGVVGTLRAG
jgi:hypothetical protein